MNSRERVSGAFHRTGYAVCFGTAGDMDFINSIARARGTEQVLIDLITDDPVYLEIMDARFHFYYEMHERVLQAADGLVDFTHIGEDLGTQQSQVIECVRCGATNNSRNGYCRFAQGFRRSSDFLRKRLCANHPRFWNAR